MNFHQFISILWFRKTILLLTLIVTTITALVISLLLPKQYVSTASIMVDQRSIDPLTGLSLPVQLMPGYMATQVDIISSHNVALKVVEKLKLSENQKWLDDFAKSKSTGSFSDWAADSLSQKHLDINPSRESSLIQLDFTYTDPEFAARAANTFIDAYIQTSIEMHAQPAKLNAEWFSSQITILRDRLEKAQAVVSTYEQEHGIVATDDRLDLESTRLAELSKQLVESQAHTSELQSRKDLLTSVLNHGESAQSLPEVLNSPLIQTLKSELAKAEAKLAEVSKRLDVNHPLYQQSKAEVSSLQLKLQSEIKMVLTSINSAVTASNQRDSILAKSLADQKTKVLELKKQHDEIAVFKREVENAQRAYDTAMQRAGQTRMESEMNQANISILGSAIPPQKHAKPRILINVILSAFLGGMLGIGLALLAEIMDRRIRSAFDVSEMLGIPVFASVSASVTDKTSNIFSFSPNKT
jgi:polysaccharide biosynthesis transport protein